MLGAGACDSAGTRKGERACYCATGTGAGLRTTASAVVSGAAQAQGPPDRPLSPVPGDTTSAPDTAAARPVAWHGAQEMATPPAIYGVGHYIVSALSLAPTGLAGGVRH